MSSMGNENVERNSVSSRGNSMVVRVQDSHQKLDERGTKQDEEANQVVTDFQWDKQELSFGDKAEPLLHNEVSYEDQ